MQLSTRCIPWGALPYNANEPATMMQAKFFEKMPYLAFLPKMDQNDNIFYRSLSKIPGIKIEGGYPYINTDTKEFKEGIVKLDEAFSSLSDDLINAYSFEGAFFGKFMSLCKRFTPPNACVNLLGPLTISQKLNFKSKTVMTLADKIYRKFVIQSVALKAVWIVREIKKVSPTTKPIIILEEDSLNQVSELCRENEEITPAIITGMLAKVVDIIKSEGAYVAVQCFTKCNWQIPINAGIDMISFDAYNNTRNLNIIPDAISEFVARGGKINWCIVPTRNETCVKSLNLEEVYRILTTAFGHLRDSGVPIDAVFNSATVSLQGSTDHLPIIFAEKAILLANQLSKKIPFITSGN